MITVYQVHSFTHKNPHLATERSRSDKNAEEIRTQWLGEGYYFWEHIVCAQLWVQQRPKSNIYSAKIPLLGQADKFLDLHCKTDDMIDFYFLFLYVKKGLEARGNKNNPTLSRIIGELHKKNFFKNKGYLGIKLSSPWNRKSLKMADMTKEKFYFLQKIQYCIFEFAKNEINEFKEYHLSDQEKEKFEKLYKKN